MTFFDAHSYSYPFRRNAVYAPGGMVETSQPLATQTWPQILQASGNAIDYAIVAAAALTVVEPTATGIGGDAFALVCHGGKLHGLNASGPAPRAASIDAYRKLGCDAIPLYGPL